MSLFFFLISFFTPKTVEAIDLQEITVSDNSIITKIQEGVEYFFAFSAEKKIQVLEKHAEKRLVMAQDYAEKGNNEKVQGLIQNYLQVKERQNNLLEKTDKGEVLGAVQERTIEQQKTMEEIKTKIDEGGKQEVIQVQEQVVNQVVKRVIDVNGSEGATEFLLGARNGTGRGSGSGCGW